MADDVCIPVITTQLEIPVIGREPGVEHLLDLDPPAIDVYDTRLFFAAMAGVAFDTQHGVATLTRENCFSSS
jgi:hypothetical protein